MSTERKFMKKKKEKHAGKLLAMQHMLMMHADKVITTWVMGKLSELKEHKQDLRYDEISHLIIKLIEDIKEPGNEEVFDALAGIVYTESEEDEVRISETYLNTFIAKAKDYVTVERMVKILEEYNPAKEKMDSILDGVRIANELNSGEEYEVVSEVNA